MQLMAQEDKSITTKKDEFVLTVADDPVSFEPNSGKDNNVPLTVSRDPQLAGYPPDCGTKGYKFLSMAKVKRVRGETHPMSHSKTEKDVLGNPVPENLPIVSTSFGSHSFHRLETDSTVLNKYGVGMVLYFKYLVSSFAGYKCTIHPTNVSMGYIMSIV